VGGECAYKGEGVSMKGPGMGGGSKKKNAKNEADTEARGLSLRAGNSNGLGKKKGGRLRRVTYLAKQLWRKVISKQGLEKSRARLLLGILAIAVGLKGVQV